MVARKAHNLEVTGSNPVSALFFLEKGSFPLLTSNLMNYPPLFFWGGVGKKKKKEGIDWRHYHGQLYQILYHIKGKITLS